MPNHERMATWWMHWPDLQWPDSDNLDKIKARADGFAEAGVTAAMFFGAHFRWDFLPVFPLLHDYIATVAEQLHSRGVKLFDHHSVNLVHRYSTREEMRRVMIHSGPHLPFSPTFEAAESWQYKGKYLNDWRMLDVKSGKPLWFPQYTAQGFCPRNPEFRESYQSYAKQLIADTGIDGLSADDAMYFLGYNACSCEHCRSELRRRTGIELPNAEDRSFWGNWDNPAWHQWIDLRLEGCGEFYRQLRAVLPHDFMLTGCGANSASAKGAMNASDARNFLQGWNYVNMEMSGNTPPYKQDKQTANTPIAHRLVNASHHQAAARERGVGAFCTGFAHSAKQANVVWAVSKMLGADAWIGTLKTRLGLPWHILNTIPNEQDIVGQAFCFERDHAALLEGGIVGQLGVYFSYETRNHSCYGNLDKGYAKDYADTLRLLFQKGISPHTVFEFPKDASHYPLLLLPGAARMTDAEKAAMAQYLAAGGKVIALGPTAIDGCKHNWVLPNRVDEPAEAFFSSVPDGVHVRQPQWLTATTVTAQHEDHWQQPRDGLYYNPCRPSQTDAGALLALVERFAKPMPIKLLRSEGFLSTLMEDESGYTLQLVAEDYDVDIDHKLDEMRVHRSRVNLITHIAPLGTDGTVLVQSPSAPVVHTPFCDGAATVSTEGNTCRISLPQTCAYALLRFEKQTEQK